MADLYIIIVDFKYDFMLIVNYYQL